MMAACSKCLSYIDQASGNLGDNEIQQEVQCCPICLGVFSSAFKTAMKQSIDDAVRVYGSNNQFSIRSNSPSMHIAGDIAYRYALASSQSQSKADPPYLFCQEVKNQIRETLVRLCTDMNEKVSMDEYPECVREGELGYLAVHVVLIPSSKVERPNHLLPTRHPDQCRSRKRNYKTQGGDPAVAFESKLWRKGHTLWSMKDALAVMDNNKKAPKEASQNTLQLLRTFPVRSPMGLDIHVAVWRRPFYLRGMYTKARRDVSQTPFDVVENGKRRRLGVTSVEEQITPAITRACGGISEQNNDPDNPHRIYGMAKFHASGREDMNVRMLLPDHSHQQTTSDIIGRPFAYEVYDAYILPRVCGLEDIINDVNHYQPQNECCITTRTYGANPLGVGISPDLKFVPASAFSGLQNETEGKIKYYGCMCWSRDPLPSSDDELNAKLGAFPLPIQQRTPIRVLHRRNNVFRQREVLSCHAQRVDDHYFRLHLSTTAGTYVKEFVHGDLGRTVPSISTLLGCTTDIMELDCEGIKV